MSRSFASHIARRTASAIVTTACLAGMFIAASAALAQGLYQSPAPNLPTGDTPLGVASADFQLSGYQSMVVTDSARNNIKVYLATGPGTFSTTYTQYPACTTPTAVLTGDANGDGYPDIAVACTGATSNNIYLYINDGTGHFGTSYPFTASHPVAMTSGDFLGDGTVDLAVAGSNGTITILLNVGGTVVTKTVTSSGNFSGIATADFNHDGHLDLAVSDSANNRVRIFTGDGAGNFTASSTTYTVGSKPSGIVTADFNHDGNPDLAVTNAGGNSVSILLGSAGATFAVQPAVAAGLNPIAIATADVDSDGNPDVIAFDGQNTTSTAENAVVVLLGNGNGTLQKAQISGLSDTPGTEANVADFNRDGKPDLAITQQTTSQVSLLLNNTLPTQYPDGRSFSSAKAIANGHGNMADSVTTGDFNEDGKLDIAVAYLEDNVVSVLTNNGAGGFNTAVPYAVGQQPYDVVSGDLNGDGYPDLVAVNTSLNSPTGTVSVLLNNRNGTFAPAATYTVGRLPYQVAIGDINGDGYPDLAVTNYGANTVSILYGSKTGTFTTGPTLPTGTNPYGVAIGNFSGKSGFGDIAVTCYNTSQLYVFKNQGDGTFGTFITSTDAHPTSLVVGDFNRDGKLDIVTGNSTANDVSFFAGHGDGSFAAGVISPSLNFPDSIAAGDINGDGILDIVGVAPNFNAVEVTLGVGDGTFGTFSQRAAGQFAATKQPWAVALGDFNNDGQLDIVTANTFNQVNLALPAYQQRYMTEYPPVTGGNPSIDLLTNYSGANISLAFSPGSPLPANNTGTTITATVEPALGGPTPTGSVIFEDSSGAPLGSGPYDLTGGVASYATGHLGSGSYLFTTLYSGDAKFQPTTVSGSTAAITVAGTPVTLSLSPSTVGYGSSFTGTVTVIGNAATGSYPKGTATIYISSGGTFTAIGTTGALTQVAGNHTSTRTITLNTRTPYLAIGSYELYAIYNPVGGSPYPTGTSSEEPLTVTINSTTTAFTLGCANIFFASGCVGQVSSATGANPSTGTVALTVNGTQVNTGAVNGTGGFAITYSFNIGTQYYITATYEGTADYTASTSSTYSLCEFCGFGRTSPIVTLDSFTGSGTGVRAAPANRNVPFSFFY